MDTMLTTASTDKFEIDNVTNEFFGVFNNTDQRQPDWTTLDRICIAETIIIKKAGPDQTVYNLASFIAPRKALLSNGTLTNFQEKELQEETTIVGHIAQRHSKYQKAGCLNGTAFTGNGTKLFQFIKTTEGWKINSLVWEDD